MSFTGNAAGWTILTGTDVTDIDFNQSTVYIGTDSIEFKATSVATKIQSGFVEIPLAAALECSLVFRRTSGTGLFRVQVDYFDATKASLGLSAVTDFNLANGVWAAKRFIVSANSSVYDNRVRFIRITVGKVSATAEQFFLGAFDFRQAHRGFKVFKSGDQIIETGSGEQVTWDSESFDHGRVLNSNAWDPFADNTGAAHALKHGADYQTIWQFNARGRYSNLADGEVGTLRLRRNGSTVEATSGSATGAANSESMQLSEILLMAESDTLDVFTKTSSGSSRTLAGSEAGACSFSGWELSP